MNLGPAVLAGALALAFASTALGTRRLFASAVGLAAFGASVSVVFLSAGFTGVAAAALAGSWGVAGAGLVVGWNLSRVESPEEAGRRGPWVLAMASSAILAGALGLGVLAVDWPAAPAVPAVAGPEAPAGALEAWGLAALALAAAGALVSFSPREDGGS